MASFSSLLLFFLLFSLPCFLPFSLPCFLPFLYSLTWMLNITVTYPLMMELFFEKDIVYQFHHHVCLTECTYTNLHGYNDNCRYSGLELTEGPSLTTPVCGELLHLSNDVNFLCLIFSYEFYVIWGTWFFSYACVLFNFAVLTSVKGLSDCRFK